MCLALFDICYKVFSHIDYPMQLCYYITMKEDKLSKLSLELANQCINLAKQLLSMKEHIFADQIKRSATSVAANIAEAGHPQSRADMISKFEIALKEAFETGRWLQMIKEANLVDEQVLAPIDKLCTKIRVLLISSIRTLKAKQ